MSENFDLLGDPIPEGFGRRGRPPHNPTTENRLKVRMLLAFDWDEGKIAKSLRITPPTLKKHYFRELRDADEARPALEGELIATTIREARAGNASMMKEAFKLLERHDLERLGISLANLRRQPKEPKYGKKEAKRLAALEPDPLTPMGELLARRQGSKPN